MEICFKKGRVLFWALIFLSVMTYSYIKLTSPMSHVKIYTKAPLIVEVTNNPVEITVSTNLPPLLIHLSQLDEMMNITKSFMQSDPALEFQATPIYTPGHVHGGDDICPDQGNKLQLLIITHSSLNNQKVRMAIRNSWGLYGKQKDFAIAFILGTTTDKELQENIKQEQNLYKDIILENFIDTYENLTLKTISMVDWVSTHCSKAAFILKTDDDMFINIPHLFTRISTLNQTNRAIYGRLAKHWRPIRIKLSKYYISRRQYRPSFFPDFTIGSAYLFPAMLSGELYETAINTTYIQLEDVFLTGIVASRLGIKRVSVPGFVNKWTPLSHHSVDKIIAVHRVSDREMYNLWKQQTRSNHSANVSP